jgi:hypothetical protein
MKKMSSRGDLSKELFANQYQRRRVQDIEAPLSGPNWKEVSITVMNALVGAGVLGLPYALRQVGWLGIAIILVVTVITACTAKMLVWSFNTLNERKQRDPDHFMGKGFCLTYDQVSLMLSS